MNIDLELIENYVNGQLAPDDRVRFEAALRTDPAVAEALAFYTLAKQVAREQAREQRKAELDALRHEVDTEELPVTNVRPLWSAPMRWVAAASVVLLLGLGWYFLQPTDSATMATRLSSDYITEHFTQLPITMDGGSSGSPSVDSLKLGINLFNKGKLADAERIAQAVLTRQPDNDSALKLVGIVSLRQGKYEQAINQFHQLSERTDLYSNPGLFYESIALLKRGSATDTEKAKQLLNEVITKNLEGKRDAERLIEQL